MSTKTPIVGFLGLSHLGIVSALSLASKGVYCVGIDQNHGLVEKLSNQEWPIQEPGISHVFEKAEGFIQFRSDLEALTKCNFVYISQDVPTDGLGKSDLTGIESLIRKAVQFISPNTIIIVLCQVPPGFSRKMMTYHPNLYYQVETLIFGQAFERAISPERIIIGVEDPEIALDVDFESIVSNFSCPILIMDYESAEFTKISINAFLAASITTTNVLNEIATVVGAKWSDIRKAVQLDRRIGQFAYLKPGLGISGGNIERDLRTLARLESKDNDKEGLFETFITFSEKHKDWIFEAIRKDILIVDPHARIGILGIAYKENTHSTKNSMAIEVIQEFLKNIVGTYDPRAIMPKDSAEVRTFLTAEECILSADSIVIMTPWDEFAKLDFREITAERSKPMTLIDPYGIINHSLLPSSIVLIGLS